ncbi:MAG TPA: PLP-dependent aminotransferase family protein [Thermoanaerobaculia bacterium]
MAVKMSRVDEISCHPGLRLARSMASMSQSGLREIMDLISRPGVLSLAIGMPAPELFPRQALAEEAARLLAADSSSLQYGIPWQPLKTQIVELMAMRGVRCREEQIFLTSGSQQSIDLLARLLLDPGGQVMMEWAVYDGAQMAVKLREPEILTVSTDLATGIDVDEVEGLLARGARPAFLYVIPDGHNPLGVSVSVEKRHRLCELARRYGVPILEDDAYGFLYYGETPAPPLRAFEEEWVFYLGSFSKILAPSLRAGWMVLPEALLPRVSALKHATDLDTPSFSHRVIAGFLESGRFPGHLAVLRNEYRRRRDAMLAALEAHFPPEVTWNRPTSGMFVWAELPPGMDAAALLRIAVETENVAFCPGVTLCAGDRSRGSRCMRLSFANAPERIEEAVRSLGRLIRNVLRESSA